MSESLYNLKEEAIGSFKEQLFDRDHDDLLTMCRKDNPDDMITEIADSAVPVYTGTILKLAANDIELATEPSELRGEGTPIEIITDNIYCALRAAQHEWWTGNKDEIEEQVQAVVDALESFQDAIKYPDVDDQYEDEAAVLKLIGALAKEHGAEDEMSVIDEDKETAEEIFDVLSAWYDKHTAKEKDDG